MTSMWYALLVAYVSQPGFSIARPFFTHFEAMAQPQNHTWKIGKLLEFRLKLQIVIEIQ